MRRTLFIALGTAVALVTAAVAFAAVTPVVGIHETPAATAFSTTGTVGKLKTSTCTENAQTWKFTDGQYTGTVVSTDPVLSGTLRIHAHTTVNTTSTPNLGYVDGSFKIRDDDSRVNGNFSGTLKDGKLVGFLTARSHGNRAKVLGNLSATFAGDTSNFTEGLIGVGSSSAVIAVIAGRPACKAPKTPKPPKSAKRVRAEGVATIIAPVAPAVLSTITVTPKGGPTTPPCVIPAAFPLAGVVTGSKVEMQCEWVGVAPATPVLTLTKLKLHK